MSENIDQIRQQAIALVEKSYTLNLSTINEEGFPRPVVILRIANEGLKVIIGSTHLTSDKVKHIRANPKAGVFFIEGSNTCSIIGTVEIFDDEETKKNYWNDYLLNYYPGGPTDPNYCVIKFTSIKANYFINFKSIKNDLL